MATSSLSPREGIFDPNVVAATIIDGDRNGSVVTIENGEDDNCVLSGFTITNGSSEYGGGIYCSGSQDPPPLPPPPYPQGLVGVQSSQEILSEPDSPSPTIKNCIISNNSAGKGGGMYNDQSNPTLSNCTFTANSSDYGGGMFNAGQSDTTLTDCTFNDNSALVGGGFYNHWYSTITLTKCTLYNNLADDEGGGAYNAWSISTMTGCTFNGNVSTDDGGGMYNDQSALTLINCTFTHNSAIGSTSHSTSDGGGMYNDQSTLTLINCTFTHNSVIGSGGHSTSDGGGMYNDHSNLNLTNCAFNENSADHGGGMYNNNSSPTITNCAFSENSAGSGGGMYNLSSSPTLTNCAFSENSASSGGGMFSGWSTPIVANCTFIANSGAGMANYYNSNLTMNNCMFSGNSSPWGGGMHNHISTAVMANCTFTGNTAYRGGGIYNSGITTLANCILWDNRGEDGTDESAQIYADSNETPIIINYSCIQGWTGILGGIGNVGADPCFVELGYWDANERWIDGDYHLLSGSPCINTGDPNDVAAPNDMDLDGNSRIIGGQIDMGAYEAPPPAEARITPRTINLASKGNSITCYIWLPENYDVADVDPNSILLQGKIEAESVQIDQGKQVVTAKFRYEQLQEILDAGVVELTIRVRLTNATIFHGKDVIRVTNKESGGKPDKYEQAAEPNPADGQIEVSRTADLSWTAGFNATSRDVYFGTVNPPPFIGNQTATTFDPGTMDYEKTYYWRIDEINKWGTTTGQIWSFTTIPIPPPPQPPPP
ncbi:MAG: right-handed parallel beta-helix repeat-containing protein [Planctomycetota bacterium]